MMVHSNNIKNATEVAENMNETFLDKRLSVHDETIGEHTYWAEKINHNQYLNAFTEMIKHDLKIRNGVLNINIHNIPCLLRLGLMPNNEEAFNIIGSDTASKYELTRFFDGMLRDNTTVSAKRLKKNFKNILKSKKIKALLKKIVYQEMPNKGDYANISNFFIFACLDNPKDKINFIVSKVLNDSYCNKTQIIKGCFGIDVEYIEKNKQDFLKIPQKQRKQIYSALAKKEKNIFKKVALKNCLAA